jgi:hypothetical protein
MKYCKPKFLGLALLAVGIGLLSVVAFGIGQSNELSLAKIIAGLGGIVCLVSGALLNAGFVGGDPVVARMRDEARQRGARPHLDTRGIPEAVFSYFASTWKKFFSMAPVVTMALGTLAVPFVFWALLDAPPLKMAGVPLLDWGLFSAPFFAAGLFGLSFARAVARGYVKIDPEGMEVRAIFKTVKIKWDEIVSLTARQIVVNGQPTTRVFKVYSQEQEIYFTDRLQGSNELIALLSRVTGLTWQ